ncbi:hypothetical protein K239x_35440 [Planctomycetes bacterium K23_9]|uniref:Uncharacterized protein n=1 Tax=Stieleria marina TaxID=1930275 RepID=A0A517NWT3_9BACT|nr:hypothetical protein K239x_35440 [Planctomycetes bacterium K23_9]
MFLSSASQIEMTKRHDDDAQAIIRGYHFKNRVNNSTPGCVKKLSG